MSKRLPRYPVYVISKGRAEQCLTARFFERDGVKHRIIVEPQEADQYAEHHDADRLLILPFQNLGLGSIPARNWVFEHAVASGARRHWIFDDNIQNVRRTYRGKRIPCDSGPALVALEDFTDRYENAVLVGMNYQMFGLNVRKPFVRNTHVYSNFLIDNQLRQRWRGRYNEDTDLCLQVLAAGLCTVLVNVFLVHKLPTMTMKGGNSAELYLGDGRLRMARSLERLWPGVVAVDRRYGRPQHVVDWKKFDTPLRLRPGVDLAALPRRDEYGMDLAEVRPIQAAAIRRVREEFYADRS